MNLVWLYMCAVCFFAVASHHQVWAEAKPQGFPAQESLSALKQIAALSLLATKTGHTPLQLGDIWSSCSKPGEKLKITAIDIRPDPPLKGQALVVNASFILSEDVTGGDVKLNIAIDNVTVVSQDLDLCDTLPEVNLMCPLKSGHHIASIETDLPNEIPSGHITGSQYLEDQNGSELVCIKLDFHLS